jgi:hypothetical protein
VGQPHWSATCRARHQQQVSAATAVMLLIIIVLPMKAIALTLPVLCPTGQLPNRQGTSSR